MSFEFEIVRIVTTDWPARACITAQDRVAAELAEPIRRSTVRDADAFIGGGLKFFRGLKRHTRSAAERQWRRYKLAQDTGDAQGKDASLEAIRALDKLYQLATCVDEGVLAELLRAHWNQRQATT
jgi:hypothetical protein